MARPDAKSEWANLNACAVGISAQVHLSGGRTSRKEGSRRNRAEEKFLHDMSPFFPSFPARMRRTFVGNAPAGSAFRSQKNI